MSPLAIDCQALGKKYGEFHSLRECSFQVEAGQVCGLLGPNGAGKTTLLRILLGFLAPTSGQAFVSGYNIRTQSLQVRSATAYLPGEPRLYRSLTGTAVLELFCGLHPLADRQQALRVADRLQLDLNRRVMFMSTGMRQKLALSIIFGNRSPLVILDEPTANLDPNIRDAVVDLITEARGMARTVVLSSHIFSDIDLTCDEVVILQAGTAVAQKSLAEIGSTHIITGRASAAEHGPPPPQLAEQLDASPFVSYWTSLNESHAGSGWLEVHLDADPQHWLNWLAGLGLEELKIERAGVRAFFQQVRHQHASGELGYLPEGNQEAAS